MLIKAWCDRGQELDYCWNLPRKDTEIWTKKGQSRSVEPISLSEVITVSNFGCPIKKCGNKRNPLSIWTYWNEIFENVRHLFIDFWAHKIRHRNHFGQWNLEKSLIKSFTRIVSEIPSKIFSNILLKSFVKSLVKSSLKSIHT